MVNILTFFMFCAMVQCYLGVPFEPATPLLRR